MMLCPNEAVLLAPHSHRAFLTFREVEDGKRARGTVLTCFARG